MVSHTTSPLDPVYAAEDNSAPFFLPLCTVFQCCPDDGVKVHLRPCDLRTINKLCEQGHYSTVVSVGEQGFWAVAGERELGL